MHSSSSVQCINSSPVSVWCRSRGHCRYPFRLSLVGKDGLSCATCPWYRYARQMCRSQLLACYGCAHMHTHTHTFSHRFCRGCPINCDDSAFGDHSPYIAIDWDVNTLHLKYQSAQERVRKKLDSICIPRMLKSKENTVQGSLFK